LTATVCIHELTAGCLACADRAEARAWAAGAEDRAAERRFREARAAERREARRTRRLAAQLAEEARIRDREAAEAAVTEALRDVETGVRDAKADGLGADASESDLYHELAGSVTLTATPQVRAEVRRRLGF
jgi:hypothetical protein